jgi:hypothetical protein
LVSRLVLFFSVLYTTPKAGALVFLTAFLRPFLTNWLTVGIFTLTLPFFVILSNKKAT